MTNTPIVSFCSSFKFSSFKISSFMFQVSRFKFHVFKFQVSSFKFQVSSVKFQVSSVKFQVSIYKLWVGSLKLQATHCELPNCKSQTSNCIPQSSHLKTDTCIPRPWMDGDGWLCCWFLLFCWALTHMCFWLRALSHSSHCFSLDNCPSLMWQIFGSYA